MLKLFIIKFFYFKFSQQPLKDLDILLIKSKYKVFPGFRVAPKGSITPVLILVSFATALIISKHNDFPGFRVAPKGSITPVLIFVSFATALF